MREYFAKALIAYPDLRFDLQTVYAGVNGLTISYRSVKNLLAAEVMLFDGENRVAVVYAHYAECYFFGRDSGGTIPFNR